MISFQIANETDFWNWSVEVLVPALGGQSSLKKGLMKDNVNKVVGYAMLRQVRVRKGDFDRKIYLFLIVTITILESCVILKKVKHLFHDCVDFVNVFNLDNEKYGPGWSKEISKLRPEYHFVSPTQLRTLPKKGTFGTYGYL